MSLDKDNEVANAIGILRHFSQIMEKGEKLAIPVISAKLHKMAEAHPYDQTIIAMDAVITKMENHDKLFITQSELKSLYNKLYSRNSKFAEYFKDELGTVATPTGPTIDKTQETTIDKIHEKFSDPILSNALDAAFGNDTLKSYSSDVAAQAKRAVASNLDMWNLRASKVDVESGNENFIIVKADYNTPKGVTSIFVPVETIKGKVVEPEVFMCNAGPQDLNHVNIKKYLIAFAGTKSKVRSQDILAVLTKQATGKDVINSVEMAMTKMASKKEHVGDFGGVVGLEPFKAARADVAVPKSAQADSFAAKFSSPGGIAGFKFGEAKLNNGRDAVVRTLAGMGIKNPQISVVACDEKTIFFGVSLFGGKTAFKVPVKIANDKVLSPEVLICDGKVASFTKETISDLFVNNSADAKVVAATSPQHNLNPSELVQNVKAAVIDSNFAKAEDALNILQQSGNESAYKEAFALYINNLGVKKVASGTAPTCSRIIKNANSSHPICGHTNLPLHKVYQDAHGNCQPNYRKGMEETYQGAFFMNSKIFG